DPGAECRERISEDLDLLPGLERHHGAQAEARHLRAYLVGELTEVPRSEHLAAQHSSPFQRRPVADRPEVPPAAPRGRDEEVAKPFHLLDWWHAGGDRSIRQLPAAVAMAVIEFAGVEDFGKNFQRFDQARAGA